PRQQSLSSRASVRLNAFSRSGRLSVIVATASSMSTTSVSNARASNGRSIAVGMVRGTASPYRGRLERPSEAYCAAPMYVQVDLGSQPPVVTLEEPDDTKRFHVEVVGGTDVGRLFGALVDAAA